MFCNSNYRKQLRIILKKRERERKSRVYDILFDYSRLNPMGLWCALDETYSASGSLYVDDGESIGMLTWLQHVIVIVGTLFKLYFLQFISKLLLLTAVIFVLESREIFYTEITNIVNIVGFFSFSDSYTTGKYLELKFELKEVLYLIKNAYLIPK